MEDHTYKEHKQKTLLKHNSMATNNYHTNHSYKHIFYKPRATNTKSLKNINKRGKGECHKGLL